MIVPARIVVIEDHGMVREGLAALLAAEADIEVVGICADASEALAVILEKKPNVVLTDIGLPHSPFDMIREARLQLPELKVIFVTAYDTELNIERAVEVGASGFISKAFAIEHVCDAIRIVLSGQDFFPESYRSRLATLRSSDGASDGKMAARHRLLSPREYEVLQLVAKGLAAKQIAKQLEISVKTVDRHKSNIMTKLNMHNQVDLARYAIREGLIDP